MDSRTSLDSVTQPARTFAPIRSQEYHASRRMDQEKQYPDHTEPDFNNEKRASWNRHLSRQPDEFDEHLISIDPDLPPADGGKGAWLFLVACFFVEALIWGFPFAFGVFEEYYSSHEPFSSHPSGIAAVGTTASGIMYMIGVILFPLYGRFPRFRVISPYVGFALIIISLVAGSFANEVWQLLLTQGVLYAIGGGMVYYPTTVFLDEWFIKKKGFAFGIMWAGTGAAGLVIPFVMSTGLEKFGFRTMLRAYAVAIFVLSSPLVYFLRPRLPHPAPKSARPGPGYPRSSSFWLLQIGNIIEGLGYFIPTIYLPSYATYLGYSTEIGTLLVTLVNTASVLSAVALGMLCDRWHVTTVVMFSTIGSVISVFLLWGFATQLPLLIIFSLVYGLFAGGWTSTYAGTIKEVTKREPGADVGILIGLLSAGRGVGAVVSGPLSESLLGLKLWQGQAEFAWGTGYGGLIIITGVTAALGGISFLGRRVGWM